MRKARFYSICISMFCLVFAPAGSDQGRMLAAPGGRAAQQQEPSTELRVQAGRSLVINSQTQLQRVSVTNSDVATAIIVSPTQVLIHGLKAGTVTLILWDSNDRTRPFNLVVELDLSNLTQLVAETFPNEPISVSQSGPAVVLKGSVSSKAVADRAAALAASQGAGVVNLLVPTEGRHVVMLQVKFAEVDRAATTQLGLNLMALPPSKTIAAISTQQFSPPQLQGGGITPQTGGYALTDIMNVFFFRPDLDLAGTIKALQQKNLLQILAEPNVMALEGREASFLAGGEFPFPVLQPSAAGSAVTIQFREFGVRLNFTPTVMEDGSIRLKVAPEVSSLDFANALNIQGFLIPALSSRKAQTEVELKDGQSFAIAGLIDNRLTEIASKVPLLGDIPILGNLFKSRSTNKNNSELMVLITPRVVKPLDATEVPAGPTFPKQFLDRPKFDGNPGEAPKRP
jgi:pilus assembly protein CpaC